MNHMPNRCRVLNDTIKKVEDRLGVAPSGHIDCYDVRCEIDDSAFVYFPPPTFILGNGKIIKS